MMKRILFIFICLIAVTSLYAQKNKNYYDEYYFNSYCYYTCLADKDKITSKPIKITYHNYDFLNCIGVFLRKGNKWEEYYMDIISKKEVRNGIEYKCGEGNAYSTVTILKGKNGYNITIEGGTKGELGSSYTFEMKQGRKSVKLDTEIK